MEPPDTPGRIGASVRSGSHRGRLRIRLFLHVDAKGNIFPTTAWGAVELFSDGIA